MQRAENTKGILIRDALCHFIEYAEGVSHQSRGSRAAHLRETAATARILKGFNKMMRLFVERLQRSLNWRFCYPGCVQCLDTPWAEECNAFGVEFFESSKSHQTQRASQSEMPFANLTNTPQAFHSKTEGRVQRTLGKRPRAQES
ncbi:hypothetical protein EDS67_10700 [candidate division KSB1 bacterium]|nr:MAG: hypothetical protein EDS67_10700 [candidate division KSB1 bacterium]MCE7945260.1 hypothetical protein [Chlorobi bacterium CHB1]